MDINKPVAWMDENENVIFEKNWAYPIPLYTHPVKELTDEEIISTMVQFDVYSNDDQCLIEAGKAILRKAQEK